MMKSLWISCSVAFLASLMGLGTALPASAADGGGISAERLERLEQRVNEMAERQEQFMRRMGAQMERQGPMGMPGNAGPRLQARPADGVVPAEPPHYAGKPAKGIKDVLGLVFLIGVFCNILLTIWIYTDIRKRGEGSGIFVAMALVAGIPAAIIYSLTRIGDRKA
jgi:hypothetical protein